MKKRYGFKCRLCGSFQKELFNCELKYDVVIVPMALCIRCMRRYGLKERKKIEEQFTNS